MEIQNKANKFGQLKATCSYSAVTGKICLVCDIISQLEKKSKTNKVKGGTSPAITVESGILKSIN